MVLYGPIGKIGKEGKLEKGKIGKIGKPGTRKGKIREIEENLVNKLGLSCAKLSLASAKLHTS